uniref:Uncharacterized protein n=1 Tax=Anguilla anguilla TaxID=7936 RepID=A0A0E9SWL9_ANGAN
MGPHSPCQHFPCPPK